VNSIALIPRPTPLPGDIVDYLKTFGHSFLAALPDDAREEYWRGYKLHLDVSDGQIGSRVDHRPPSSRGQELSFQPSGAPMLSPAQQPRYRERTMVERVNARINDEFGGRTIRVRGHAKVMAHLMFGILSLTVDQLLRIVVRRV
jgi:hypothetical protein